MRYAYILLASLLAGCASDRELRVTEYGASYLTGAAGGCRVTGTNESMENIEIIYDGDKCKVSTSKQQLESRNGEVPAGTKR